MPRIPILSIRQTWAFLYAVGAKPVENRTWQTRYRGPLLIHASKRVDNDEDNLLFLEEHGVILPPHLPTGGIVGGITVVDCVKKHRSPYFFGPYGFVGDKATELPFVPLKGRLMMFYDSAADKSARQYLRFLKGDL